MFMSISFDWPCLELELRWIVLLAVSEVSERLRGSGKIRGEREGNGELCHSRKTHVHVLQVSHLCSERGITYEHIIFV